MVTPDHKYVIFKVSNADKSSSSWVKKPIADPNIDGKGSGLPNMEAFVTVKDFSSVESQSGKTLMEDIEDLIMEAGNAPKYQNQFGDPNLSGIIREVLFNNELLLVPTNLRNTNYDFYNSLLAATHKNRLISMENEIDSLGKKLLSLFGESPADQISQARFSQMNYIMQEEFNKRLQKEFRNIELTESLKIKINDIEITIPKEDNDVRPSDRLYYTIRGYLNHQLVTSDSAKDNILGIHQVISEMSYLISKKNDMGSSKKPLGLSGYMNNAYQEGDLFDKDVNTSPSIFFSQSMRGDIVNSQYSMTDYARGKISRMHSDVLNINRMDFAYADLDRRTINRLKILYHSLFKDSSEFPNTMSGLQQKLSEFIKSLKNRLSDYSSNSAEHWIDDFYTGPNYTTGRSNQISGHHEASEFITTYINSLNYLVNQPEDSSFGFMYTMLINLLLIR